MEYSGWTNINTSEIAYMAQESDRLNILGKIRCIMGNKSEENKISETEVFCIQDGEKIPRDSWYPELYSHGNHSNPRAFVFDPTMMWEFRDDGELRHFTAGAMLWRQERGEKRYCLMRRRRYPIGYYTIPAGHIEMGETPQVSALRESFEESGLGIISIEQISGGTSPEAGLEIHDECRRGSIYHVWTLFSCECVGEPSLSEEGDVIGWFSQHEILHGLKLNKASGVFFAELFNEIPHHVRER